MKEPLHIARERGMGEWRTVSGEGDRLTIATGSDANITGGSAPTAAPFPNGGPAPAAGSSSTKLSSAGLRSARLETFLPVSRSEKSVGKEVALVEAAMKGGDQPEASVRPVIGAGESGGDTMGVSSSGSDSSSGAADLPPAMAQIVSQISAALTSRPGAPAGYTPGPETTLVTDGQAPSAATEVAKSLHFKLDQGEHGEVRVRISLGGSALRVHLSFSSDSTADVARANHQALVQALTDGGLTVAGIVIDNAAGSTPDADARGEGSASRFTSQDGFSTDRGGTRQEGHPGDEAARRATVTSAPAAAVDQRVATRAGMFL